jgi:hypothetical protein
MPTRYPVRATEFQTRLPAISTLEAERPVEHHSITP